MPSNPVQTSRPAAEVWGQTEDSWDFTTKSGARCHVRSLDLPDIAEHGLIDMMDTLGFLVEEEHVQRVQGKKPGDRQKKKPTKAEQAAADAAKAKAEGDRMMSMLKDSKKFGAIDAMITKICSACVLEPVLANPYVPVDPEDESKGERKLERHERLEGVLYADKVPFVDRMDIFGEVFQGMDGWESFREGSGQDVADLAGESESAEKPE